MGARDRAWWPGPLFLSALSLLGITRPYRLTELISLRSRYEDEEPDICHALRRMTPNYSQEQNLKQLMSLPSQRAPHELHLKDVRISLFGGTPSRVRYPRLQLWTSSLHCPDGICEDVWAGVGHWFCQKGSEPRGIPRVSPCLKVFQWLHLPPGAFAGRNRPYMEVLEFVVADCGTS